LLYQIEEISRTVQDEDEKKRLIEGKKQDIVRLRQEFLEWKNDWIESQKRILRDEIDEISHDVEDEDDRKQQ